MRNIIYTLIFFSFLEVFSQNTINTDRLIQKEKIGSDNKNFKINGFYYTKLINIKSKKDTAKYISPIILYKNGTALNFDYTGNSSNTLKIKENGQKCSLKPRQDFDVIIDYFKCLAEIVKRNKVSTVYSIKDKLLKIQIVGSELFVEKRGIILNDSTFLINQSINYMTKEFENINHIYQFKTSKKPDSTKLKPNSEIQKYFLK
mgnify:FL=1